MSHCKYHPKKTASYQCFRCSADYCSDCSDESPLFRDSQADHRCFVCESELETLSSAVEVEPFWRRLAEVYKYPTTVSPLIIIVVMAVLSTVLYSFPWFIKTIPVAGLMLYCFASLRETAEGKLDAPEFEKCFDGSFAQVSYVFWLIVLGGVGTTLAFIYLGQVVGSFVGLFFIITLPAAIMMVAIGGEFLPALNVVRLTGVVKAAGASYFVMLMFLMIMISSVGLLSSYFIQEDPSGLSLLIQAVIGNYYLIVEFHILGYIVYQNHEELGFGKKKRGRIEGGRSDDKRLEAQLDVLIKAGDYAQAKSIAKRLISQGDTPLWKWDRTLKLMCAGRSRKQLKEFWPRYLQKAAPTMSSEKLADAYVLVKSKLPKLIIEDHDLRVSLAESLYGLGRHKYVVNLLKDFHEESEDLEQIDRAIDLQSKSYSKLPGMEKNARFYTQLFEMRRKAASS